MPVAFGTTMTEVETALTGMVDTLIPIVGTIAVAALALWAIPKGVGIIKRALGKA